MADLKTPGVYLDRINTGSASIEGASTSVCAFMGLAPRGDIDSGFVQISSWTDFVQKATNGSKASVFRDDDFMAYDIYNFYQNGGGKAYFGVAKKSPVKAKVAIGADKNTVTFEATSGGAWANDLVIDITKNALDDTLFDLAIVRKDADGKVTDSYELYEKLSTDKTASRYYVNILKASELVTVTPAGTGTLAVNSYKLVGGTDGATITDDEFTGESGLIHKLDTITDCSLIVSSGQSVNVKKGILAYCTTREDMYAILDAENSLQVNEIISERKDLNGLGEIHYPYVSMSDPTTGNTIEVPAGGMIAGMYCRMDASYGVWRVGAGEEAVLRGALGTRKILTDAEFEKLFNAGVNCIMSKPNKGVLMYGARSLNQKYVSDDRLDIYIVKSIKEGTGWAVFELNDEKLWLRLTSTITSFLEGLYQRGAFKGDGNGSAFYVTCDATINTDANIEKGIVTTEFGYATKKPAEFVVHRLNKITASSN